MMKIERLSYVILLTLIIGMFSEQLYAQRWKLRRYEVGGGLGITQVFGDIGGTFDKNNLYGLRDIKFDETSMAFDAYARYKIDPLYSLKSNLVLGFGHGTDTRNRVTNPRSYKTKLLEFSVQGEYYLITEEAKYRSAAMFNRRGMLNNYASFSAYIFAGLGFVYAMPKVFPPESINPQYDLVATSAFGGVVPFGAGVKYVINDRFLMNAELGYRYTTSDYLDGITQKVASKHNDVYYFLTLSVGYRLETSRKGLPAFLDKSYRRAHPNRGGELRNKPKSKKQALH